jgi:uncharacterized coiled-coil DUF342 family protein
MLGFLKRIFQRERELSYPEVEEYFSNRKDDFDLGGIVELSKEIVSLSERLEIEIDVFSKKEGFEKRVDEKLRPRLKRLADTSKKSLSREFRPLRADIPRDPGSVFSFRDGCNRWHLSLRKLFSTYIPKSELVYDVAPMTDLVSEISSRIAKLNRECDALKNRKGKNEKVLLFFKKKEDFKRLGKGLRERIKEKKDEAQELLLEIESLEKELSDFRKSEKVLEFEKAKKLREELISKRDGIKNTFLTLFVKLKRAIKKVNNIQRKQSIENMLSDPKNILLSPKDFHKESEIIESGLSSIGLSQDELEKTREIFEKVKKEIDPRSKEYLQVFDELNRTEKEIARLDPSDEMDGMKSEISGLRERLKDLDSVIRDLSRKLAKEKELMEEETRAFEKFLLSSHKIRVIKDR